jgi:hypothetical protein
LQNHDRDGHATVASQDPVSPPEREQIAAETLMVDGAHFPLILDPKAQRPLVEVQIDADAH